MNTDRLETIKSFFKERRGEVEELFLNSPDYELTESGLFTKYAFELVDFISSPNVKGDSRRSDEETLPQNTADDDNAKTNFSAPKASSPPSCSPSWLNRLSWVAMLWIILAPLLNLESHGQIMDKLRFLWGAYPLTMAAHLAALAILSARPPRILRAVQT